MSGRIRALLRAGFQSQWGSGAWPVAPLVMHGSVSFVMCALVADVLPAFGFAFFALALSGGLVLLVLLGEFGSLLSADEAGEWIEAQPVRAIELRIARALLVFSLLAVLALASLLPAAYFLPHADLGARALFLAAGLGQAALLAALLLTVQSVLGSRAEGLLVSLQTLLVGGIVLGVVLGPRLARELVAVQGLEGLPGLARLLPSAWFAGAAPLAFGATALALLALLLLPAPRAGNAARGRTPLGLALAPLRALAARVWVKRDERASFELVFEALPKEREFVLRSYPMLGIPLAFLVAGASGEEGMKREGLLALLCFTPAIYLPVLLVHVAASRSAAARWILDSAPVSPEALASGARKALALRFVLPLYALLFALAWSQTSLEFALRMAPAGFLVSLLVLPRLYTLLVRDPPLSVQPEAVETRMDWGGPLMGLALALTFAAVMAQQFVTTVPRALLVCALLAGAVALQDRRR
ncbi:MAG: hypothetical protein IPJ19_05170 [Planctomycetes bacterium]|nr:hypothetical protein [Planctomycetota bacterium]